MFSGLNGAGFACVGLLIVAVLVVVLQAARERAKRLAREQEEEARASYEAARQAHAPTCRGCGILADPITSTRNRYRCPGCGRQFAGANHPC